MMAATIFWPNKHIYKTRNIVILTAMNMDQKIAAKALSALGHEVRLHIFRLLVTAGEPGLNVGDIGAHLGMPPSTLSHHLSALVAADLVVQERIGREIINRANYGVMNGLMGFLSDSCCAGVAPLANENVA